MPTLIPEMYALARCGHLPVKTRDSTSSIKMEVMIASAVFG